ncbi:MAG: DUF1653 domain-containing protein [Candidatus Paceibacterota bacterium]|jgi:hypothetical protein
MPHISQEELAKQLAEAGREVLVGGLYVHYKDSTKEYVVKSLGVLEATDEVAVIYEAQYGEKVSFIRPLASFCELVLVDGVSVPRFRKVQ